MLNYSGTAYVFVLVAIIYVVILVAVMVWLISTKRKKTAKWVLIINMILLLLLFCFYTIQDYFVPYHPPVEKLVEHSTIPGVIPSTLLPKADRSQTYLDDKRDLKDVYTMDEINNEKSAFYVKTSTLIYEPIYGFDPYFRQNIRSGMTVEYTWSIMKNGWEDGTLYFFELQETEYQTLEAYYNQLQKNVEYMRSTCNEEPYVFEKTDSYVFYAREYGGYYQYELFREIGGRVFCIYASTERLQGAKVGVEPGDVVREAFRRDAIKIIDHIHPDDGKTAYVYDKLVNLQLPKNRRIRSYTDISVFSGKKISLEISDERYFRIGFHEMNQDWLYLYDKRDDMYIRILNSVIGLNVKPQPGDITTHIAYMENKTRYDLEFGIEHSFDNMEECMLYLEGTGVIVKR